MYLFLVLFCNDIVLLLNSLKVSYSLSIFFVVRHHRNLSISSKFCLHFLVVILFFVLENQCNALNAQIEGKVQLLLYSLLLDTAGLLYQWTFTIPTGRQPIIIFSTSRKSLKLFNHLLLYNIYNICFGLLDFRLNKSICSNRKYFLWNILVLVDEI